MSRSAELPLLDAALLDRYERRLRAQGVPFDDWTQPGLSEAEMAELIAPVSLRLPTEARVWWGWRDGTSPKRAGWTFGPGRNCLSLSRAVEAYASSRAAAEKGAADPGLSGPRSDPEFMWHPSWLPVLNGGQLKTVLDCDVAEGEPTPIGFVDLLTQPEEYARHKARSFGEMIGWWCLALETGAWSWDAKRLVWDEDPRVLPLELQGNPLV
jgi:cell wall assembly regulator SMI1